MDMDSPDKNLERIKEVDETSLLEKPNLDSFVSKDEQRGENFTYENDVQNEEVYQRSPVQHADALNEEVYQGSPMQNEAVQSPAMRSNSTDSSSPPKNYEDSDLNHGDGKRMSDYRSERQEDVPIGQYQRPTLKEEAEGDAGKLYDVMDGQPFNQHTGRSPSLDETSNGGHNRTSAFHHEKGEIDAEMDARNLSPHAEAKEDDYPSVEASENGGMNVLPIPNHLPGLIHLQGKNNSHPLQTATRNQHLLQVHPEENARSLLKTMVWLGSGHLLLKSVVWFGGELPLVIIHLHIDRNLRKGGQHNETLTRGIILQKDMYLHHLEQETPCEGRVGQHHDHL